MTSKRKGLSNADLVQNAPISISKVVRYQYKWMQVDDFSNCLPIDDDQNVAYVSIYDVINSLASYLLSRDHVERLLPNNGNNYSAVPSARVVGVDQLGRRIFVFDH